MSNGTVLVYDTLIIDTEEMIWILEKGENAEAYNPEILRRAKRVRASLILLRDAELENLYLLKEKLVE